MEEKELEKLTATKLREIAKQYEGITGAHAMKKEELIAAIREARGEPKKEKEAKKKVVKKKGKTQTVSGIKKQIRGLKDEKKAAQERRDKKLTESLRKKIKQYRRLTRKLAKAESR